MTILLQNGESPLVLDLCSRGIHCKKGIATVEFTRGGNIMYNFRQRRLFALGAKATRG